MIPIFKSGDDAIFFNYRPENALLLKILEQLKYNRLIYIDNHYLSYGYQFG